MTPIAAKLPSNKPCFVNETRVLWKNEKCSFCPNLPVCSAPLSNRWHRCEPISSPCSDSPLPTAECLQATPSVGSSSSSDGPVYYTATFPATVWSQFKLDFKKKDNKRNEVWAGANNCSGSAHEESHATANISSLAHLQKLSTATLSSLCFSLCTHSCRR